MEPDRTEQAQRAATGVCAPPRRGSCTPLMGPSQRLPRTLLQPDSELPPPSIVATLWVVAGALAAALLLLHAVGAS